MNSILIFPFYDISLHNMLKRALVLLCFCLGIASQLASAESQKTVYTYLGGAVKPYEYEALLLALEKTKSEYGDFELMKKPQMTEARGFTSLLDKKIINGIRIQTYRKKYDADARLHFTKFPIYLGILGYRICYVHELSKLKIAHLKDLSDIKKLVHGQGNVWRDTEILRENGYKVVTSNRTENLYKMIAAKRMDLFCRGTNEIEGEADIARKYPNISLDESTMFFYELPFVAYTTSENANTSKRLYQGLVKAYKDGSLQDLWITHFGISVESAKLKERTIYTLSNSELDGTNFNFKQYFYYPK